MRSTSIKKYCSRVGVDCKRTKHNVWGFCCSFCRHMVHLALKWCPILLVEAPLLLLWGVLPSALLLLLPLLRAVVGEVPTVATLVVVSNHWNSSLIWGRWVGLPLWHSSVGRALALILITLTLTCLLLILLLLGLLTLLVLLLLLVAGAGVAVGGSRVELSFLLFDFPVLLLCKQGTIHQVIEIIVIIVHQL